VLVLRRGGRVVMGGWLQFGRGVGMGKKKEK